MIPIKAGKRRFALLIGKISTESYSTTIKKLTLVQEHVFAQIVPARLIAGKRHAEAALEHAVLALENNHAFTKSLSLEFLVRLFGEKQLGKALESAKFGKESVVLVIGAKSRKQIEGIAGMLNFRETKGSRPARNPQLSGNREELMRFYGISEKEIDAVSDLDNPLEELVIEKISMVALDMPGYSSVL